MSNLYGGLIGAAIGAYSQKDSDSTIGSAAAIGIGAYTGASLDYNHLPKIQSKILKSRIDTSNMQSQILSNLRDSIRRKVNSSTVSDIQLNNVNTIIGVNRFQSTQEILDAIKTSSDRDLLRQVNIGLSTTASLSVNSGFNPVNLPQLKSFTLSRFTSADRIEAEFLDFFEKELKNPREVAQRKASMFAKQLQGFELKVEGETLNILEGSKTLGAIPLTRYTDGVKTHTSADIQYIAKGHNPFAEIYTNGGKYNGASIGFKEVTTAFDPEEALGFVSRDSKGFGKAQTISKSLLEYVGLDAYKDVNDPFSVYSKYKSANISVENTLHFDSKANEYRYTKLNTVGEGQLKRSAFNQLIQKLLRDGKGKYDPLNSLSINSGSAIMDPNMERLGTFGPAIMTERGAENVAIRAHKPLINPNESMSIYLREMAAKGDHTAAANLEHSVVVGRMGATDQDSRLLSSIFGSHLSLDDGHAIARRSQLFGIKDRVSLTLGNVGTLQDPRFITSAEGLQEIANIQDRVARQQKIQELISGGDNRFHINPGDNIGLGVRGEAVFLKEHFSSGTISDIRLTQDGLKLDVDAVFDPSRTGWAKIFSTSSKSGVSLLDEKTFNASMALVHLNSLYDPETGRKALDVDFDKSTIKFLDHAEVPLKYRGLEISFAESKRIRKILNNKSFKKIHNSSIQLMARGSDFGIDNIKTIDEMAELATSFKKGNQDIFLTMKEWHARNMPEELDRINQLNQTLISDDSNIRGEANQYLRTAIARTFHEDEFNPGTLLDTNRTYTSFIADHGPSIHGAGNPGSISWLEQLQLRNNGFTPEMIGKIGAKNFEDLSELKLLASTSERGDVDISKLNLSAQDIDDLFEATPEKRLDILKSVAGNNVDLSRFDNSSHISFGLSSPHKGIQSIPLSLVDTDYSGHIDLDGENVLKLAEKERRNVLLSDFELRHAAPENRQFRKQDLHDSVDSYIGTTKKMLSGDNNLLKAASKLSANNSSIRIARSADGLFAEYAARTSSGDGLSLKVATSQRGMESHLARMGLEEGKDFNYETVARKNGRQVKRVNLVGKDHKGLLQLMSREPVQGAGSAPVVELMVDTSIKGKNNEMLFLPKNLKDTDGKGWFSHFSFGDFDADTVRLTSLHNFTNEEYSHAGKIQKQLLDFGREHIDLQRTLNAKNNNITTPKLADIADEASYNKFLANSGLKGRYRKNIADKVTSLVTDFNELINTNIGGLDNKNAGAARVVSHALTESLLKTAHKSTSDFTENPNGAVEQMYSLREKWLKGSLSNNEFKAELTSAINSTLKSNIDGIEDPAMKAKVLEQYNRGVEQISGMYASPEGRRTINATNNPIKATSSFAFQKETASGIVENLGNAGFLPLEEESDAAKVAMAKSKNMYSNFKNAIIDVASANKKKIGIGLAGLALVASATSSKHIEQSAASAPRGDVQTLKPLSDNKAYIRKYKDSEGMNVVANVAIAKQNLNPRRIHQTLFGDGPRTAQVNITDKSGMF